MTEIQGNIHPLTSMALGRRPADAVAARAMVVLWLTVASGCSSNSAKPRPGSGGAVATTSDAATGTGGMAAGTGGMVIGTGGVAIGTGGMAIGTGGVAIGTGGMVAGAGESRRALAGQQQVPVAW